MVMKKDKNVMNAIANVNWKDEIGLIAGPFQPTDTKQSWLARAARRANVSARYITSLYYGHVKDPKFSVASNVLSAADQARIEDARSDAAKLAGIYASAAGGLREIDEDFHRQTIDALIHASRVLGAVDRS